MNTHKMNNIGFGCQQFTFAVYLGNHPNMLEYQGLTDIHSLQPGEIKTIGLACGNGWRKVFNVYAKIIYALDKNCFSYAKQNKCWQHYRDQHLLQTNSQTALLFSPPQLQAETETIHIISGRTYAKQLLAEQQLVTNLIWLDGEFAIDQNHKLIVCPYFDYRQLSNIKIIRLTELIKQLKTV